MEFELMSFFWAQTNPVTFAEILHFCNKVNDWNWAKTTAHTYITRLVQKKLLDINSASGVRRTYFAKVSREEFARLSAWELANSSFSGSIKNLLLSLVPDKPLSQRDADELYEILDQLVESEDN